MTKTNKKKLTKRTVDSINPAEKEIIIWDSEITGYGLRVKPSGIKSYFIQYRNRHGVSRWYTLGKHGHLTPEKARERARSELGRVSNGYDPSAERKNNFQEMNVSALCDLFVQDGCLNKKPSTLVSYKSLIKHHIKPLIGRNKITAVKRSDIERMKNDIVLGKTSTDYKTRKHGRSIVRGGKGAASRTVSLLSAIYSFAMARDLAPDNPCRGIKKFESKSCDRYLSPKEFKILGDALIEAEATEHPSALNIIRMLAFTGCRRGEIQTLKWDYIDWDSSCLRLPDSKTGEKTVWLSASALNVLKSQNKMKDNPYVFYGEKDKHYFVGLTKVWNRLKKKNSCLSDVRIHDLRHSFASVGVNSGHSLMLVGALLGHRNPGTTSRYAHLSDDPVQGALSDISEKISSFMKVGKR